MAFPQVESVAPASPAGLAGVEVGDEILALNGSVLRDVIDYQLLADEAVVALELGRRGTTIEVVVELLDGTVHVLGYTPADDEPAFNLHLTPSGARTEAGGTP